MLLNWGDGASPGDIWQCLETHLVVTGNGGEQGGDATGIWWVEAKAAPEYLTVERGQLSLT